VVSGRTCAGGRLGPRVGGSEGCSGKTGVFSGRVLHRQLFFHGWAAALHSSFINKLIILISDLY
jgi:hypothetical protein